MTIAIEFYDSKARNAFGRLVRIVRIYLGLTQEEMAERISISRVRYNAIEKGHHMPKDSDHFLKRVEEVLKEQRDNKH